jgi:hypothetical protein
MSYYLQFSTNWQQANLTSSPPLHSHSDLYKHNNSIQSKEKLLQQQKQIIINSQMEEASV